MKSLFLIGLLLTFAVGVEIYSRSVSPKILKEGDGKTEEENRQIKECTGTVFVDGTELPKSAFRKEDGSIGCVLG